MQQALGYQDLMIDDLTRRVAQTALEASQWRARALLAEQALQEAAEATEEEDAEDGSDTLPQSDMEG